jgi:predicted HNH restriction endonuclease
LDSCYNNNIKGPQKVEVSMSQPNYSKIPLSQGKFAIVDTEDFEYLNQWKWSYTNTGYAYRNVRVDGKYDHVIMMHRLLNKTPDGLVTDHINRNKLDNRKANLRSATKRENSLNTERNKNNTSGEKGVVKGKNNRWKAQIFYNYKNYFIGIYDTKNEAIVAYNAAQLMITKLTNNRLY